MNALPQLSIVDGESGDVLSSEPPAVSDRLLVDAWITHEDRDALTSLVHRYENLVLGVCRRQCQSMQDAEDAFQVTFMIFARGADRVRRRENLAGWLHKVAYRTACRVRKRNPNHASLAAEPTDESTSQRESLRRIAHHHRLRVLDEELQSLSATYREAIVLHYFEGLTYQQAAVVLGTTEGTVRGRLQRGRQKLQHRLRHRGIAIATVIGSIGASLAESATASDTLSDLTIRTAANCIENNFNHTSSVDLEPLLTKDTPVIFSSPAIAITSVGILTTIGLLLAPASSDQSSEQAVRVDRHAQQSQTPRTALVRLQASEN